ncbi:DEAD-domain-containing protein [Calocera viscosa TUFC12733]|uniref:ATP-dependent RNA helicase n=1 Tax=Calocera viscosa (strain TUFC12733) TaxID=1330018 RepID=A0A167R090_CALVF|nr:DEAD-domain-containing protein [Calocera viscosa TUFC12733]
MVVNTSDKPKVKTKAKARYLKAKKERRKVRKTTGITGTSRDADENEEGGQTNVRPGEEDYVMSPEEVEENGVAGEEGLGEEQDGAMIIKPNGGDDDVPEAGERKKKQKRRKDRAAEGEGEGRASLEAHEKDAVRKPKKEKKLAPPEDEVHEDSEEEVLEPPDEDDAQLSPSGSEADAADAVEHDGPTDHAEAPMRSPTPPYLPSFPLPLAPPAPSAAELSRQGLDRALLQAELVSASLTLPLADPGVDLGIGERTLHRLDALGVQTLFAVQAALWPWLLSGPEARRGLYEPRYPPRDACVSAPTGSGKTLAYAVPIVEILSTRVVTRLRALVVLPTRDLVQQVRETMESLCKGTGLRVGSATGAQSWAKEQRQLVEDLETKLQGGSSKVDILVCTPGRLMDHLNGTPNFSLQHLRFLVIDEADRLLTQSFQSFLPQVLAAITPPIPRLPLQAVKDSHGLPVPDALAPAWMDVPRTWGEPEDQPSCQKLLFSATMTRDPGILKALGLRNPKYFMVTGAKEGEQEEAIVREEFAVPETLAEHLLVVPTDLKPLYLFHLLHTHPITNALIFTKSAESTTRLLRLLEFFESSWAAEEAGREAVIARAYSSELPKGERRAILDQFKNGHIGILVASDLIARGIDIPSVAHVVNYDAPLDMRKYVHRAGRTARAGREGDVWSLVEEQEARWVREMLKAAGHWKRVKRLRMEENVLDPLRGHYVKALDKLREVYSKDNKEA